MKTLYLLRHAKSSWDDASLPDRDRPLEARGERDAARMSKRWSQRIEKPELILSSPAARALRRPIVAPGMDYGTKEIAIDERLYAATEVTVLHIIEAQRDKLDRVMLVGHNPGFAELAHHFDSGITHMPTCALVEFRFEARTWAGIGRVKPSRTIVDSPKQPSA